MNKELIIIRRAAETDVESILDIYEPYITDTTVTFEYSVPTYDEFLGRFKRITAKYPWIVAEIDCEIVGYACADVPFSERSAYLWNADVSVYLDSKYTGRGIGRALYSALHEILEHLGYVNAYALVCGENLRSISFHERFGYKTVGRMARSGYKFGRWLDVVWLEYPLCGHPSSPSLPRLYSENEYDSADEICKKVQRRLNGET